MGRIYRYRFFNWTARVGVSRSDKWEREEGRKQIMKTKGEERQFRRGNRKIFDEIIRVQTNTCVR